MFSGVAVPLDEFSDDLLAGWGLRSRVHERYDPLTGATGREVRFLFRDRLRLLPVVTDRALEVVRWGNQRGQSKALPLTAWTWLESLRDGRWRDADPEEAVVPAVFGLDRGVWFSVQTGVRCVLVRDERGRRVAFVVVEPASRDYEVMTKCPWMPCLVDQTL